MDALKLGRRPIYNYAIKGGFPNDNGAITGLGEFSFSHKLQSSPPPLLLPPGLAGC